MATAMGRPFSFLLLLGAILVIATLFSLQELHRVSTDEKDMEDTRHRFATEFKMVTSSVESVGTAIKRAWRHNLAATSESPTTDDPPPTEKQGQCIVYRRTDLWGEALNNGATNKLDSAAECCSQCSMAHDMGEGQAPCNVWVYCGDRQWCGNQYGEVRAAWGGEG